MESENKYSPKELASKVINSELSPEAIKELLNPSVSYMKEFASALKEEINSNAKFNEKTVDSLQKICENLSLIINTKNENINEDLNSKIIDCIMEITKIIKDINIKAQDDSKETKNLIIRGGLFLAALAVVIASGGRIKMNEILKG